MFAKKTKKTEENILIYREHLEKICSGGNVRLPYPYLTSNYRVVWLKIRHNKARAKKFNIFITHLKCWAINEAKNVLQFCLSSSVLLTRFWVDNLLLTKGSSLGFSCILVSIVLLGGRSRVIDLLYFRSVDNFIVSLFKLTFEKKEKTAIKAKIADVSTTLTSSLLSAYNRPLPL